MDKEFYYVIIQEKSAMTENYPYDFELEKLEGEKKVKELIKEIYDNLIFLCREWEPFLVTNNPFYYRQYRNVFNEEEFRAYCSQSVSFGNDIDKLPLHLQLIAKRSNGTEELYQHFKNITLGKYKKAYMYRIMDTWNEEETGNSYDIEVEEGWKTE